MAAPDFAKMAFDLCDAHFGDIMGDSEDIIAEALRAAYEAGGAMTCDNCLGSGQGENIAAKLLAALRERDAVVAKAKELLREAYRLRNAGRDGWHGDVDEWFAQLGDDPHQRKGADHGKP